MEIDLNGFNNFKNHTLEIYATHKIILKNSECALEVDEFIIYWYYSVITVITANLSRHSFKALACDE